MDNPPVTLGPDEQRRLYVLAELLAGRLTTIEAALTLKLSIRQVKRLKARYRREGVASLAHGNRGRRPWHALDPELAERVVELARTRYVGLNHSHLADLLAEREGSTLERSTIRRLLVGAGSVGDRLSAQFRCQSLGSSTPPEIGSVEAGGPYRSAPGACSVAGVAPSSSGASVGTSWCGRPGLMSPPSPVGRPSPRLPSGASIRSGCSSGSDPSC
jgi:transposase